MAEPRLHQDSDASRKDLFEALLAKGHDITRTPAQSLPFDASDEFQLLWAAAHERVLFTFNVRDFLQLTSMMPEHKGVILASQRSFFLGELITALDRILRETEAEDGPGKVRLLEQ